MRPSCLNSGWGDDSDTGSRKENSIILEGNFTKFSAKKKAYLGLQHLVGLVRLALPYFVDSFNMEGLSPANSRYSVSKSAAQ